MPCTTHPEHHRTDRIGWLRAAVSVHPQADTEQADLSREQGELADAMSARPVQAALASAASFAVGAALPLAVSALVPGRSLIPSVAVTSLLFLAGLGFVSARAGGASVLRGAWRVTF